MTQPILSDMRNRIVAYTRIALVGFLLAACTAQAPGPPSLEDANAYLARVVELAQARDFDGLCAIGDGNCEDHLETAGRERVPPDPPSVIGSRIIPTRTEGGLTHIGGVVLILCGRDALDEPYRSEMLVFRDGSGLRAINPIYWGNVRIADGSTTDGNGPGPAGC